MMAQIQFNNVFTLYEFLSPRVLTNDAIVGYCPQKAGLFNEMSFHSFPLLKYNNCHFFVWISIHLKVFTSQTVTSKHFPYLLLSLSISKSVQKKFILAGSNCGRTF